MGADLLLATLAHNKNKKLDWAAGRRAAKKLDAETVLTQAEEAWGEVANLTEARRMLNRTITQLKEELAEYSRDRYTFEVGSWHIHVRGGTSYGDDPTPGWTVFSDIGRFPSVLKAIGFNLNAVKWV